MAKDAKGHGSDGKGGGGYPNIDKNMRGAGKHVGYGGGDTFHIQKSNGSGSNWYSAVGQRSGQVVSGKGLGAISSRLSGLPQDGAAKAELARGSQKSAAVPVHPGAAGRSDFGPGHTVSQITLGGKVKSTQSARDWAGRTDADLAKDYGGPVRHFDGK